MIRRACQQTSIVLEMIKFEHSVFALPFAFTSALIGCKSLPSAYLLGWIIAACVCARTSAMSFNRWADARIDAMNPRTAARAIPAGRLGKGFALGFSILSALLFVICAAMINRLAFALSPLALVILLGYSYTKRFTCWSHIVLGLALGLAPVGAWIAVKGDIAIVPLLIAAGVLSWTSGFDLIYSCQDYDADVRQGLFSFPARYGIANALRLSALFHFMAVMFFAGTGVMAGMGWLYYCGVFTVAILLYAEHRIVNPSDLSRIDVAFFTVNSWVGMVILAFTALDLFTSH